MDDIFEIILYVGAIIVTAVIGARKAAKEVKNPVPKKAQRKHIFNEKEEEYVPESRDFEKEVVYGKTVSSEPFSYETMSERDFQKEFSKNVESEHAPFVEETHNSIENPLTFDEEEIYKGVIYSEILKRKY